MLKKRLPTNSTTKTVFQKISSKSALQNFRAGKLFPSTVGMVPEIYYKNKISGGHISWIPQAFMGGSSCLQI